MKNKLFLLLTVWLTTVFILSGCEIPRPPEVYHCGNRVSPTYDNVTEAAFCSPTVYSTSVDISGTAQYEPRELYVGGLGNPGMAKPIRYAEVVVKNSAGSIIQCGSTNGGGAFSLSVPPSSDSHTISVRSRGNNSNIKASVLNCPEENGFYELSTGVIPDSTKSVGSFAAKATGEVLSAAFNIFDQFVEANDFLRSKVGTCPFTGCANFTVAPKVTAYWAKGYNPNSYFGASSGVSFYLPGHSKLFILGGQNGDVDSSDTDHFDNSVVLHEYGHFLEDIYTDTDSPGGSHSGNKMIDPRLAWGEGWGNFFQAAVLNSPFYVDTSGNIDGSTGYIFNLPLEQPPAYCGVSPLSSGCDVPQQSGEGNFREFAIARFLWDVHDDATEGPDDINGSAANVGFSEIWASLVSSTGFLNPQAGFRSIGLLHDIQTNTLAGSATTDWSNLRTNTASGLNHLQTNNRSQYATYVDDTGACGANNFSITPVNAANDVGDFSTSDLVSNNDFYHFKHTGGPLTATLTYLVRGPGTIEPDIDLYIYRNDYYYGNSSTMAGYSQKYFDNNVATAETETVSANLAAGDYLINIKTFTGVYQESTCIGTLCQGQYFPTGHLTDYQITINGVRLCPATLP